MTAVDTSSLQWSPQQDTALAAVKAWLADKKGSQVFRLFGYAGTGKTTMAQEINAMVKGRALFMCFTGKAAMVLRKKGCAGASTIHSAIYKPIMDKSTGHVEFVLNRDSDVAGAPLVIVDEVSQVGEELGNDLLSFGTRILVLGDPFQLPPIKGEGFFTAQEPDILLTEIHRQARDNPIIRMSMDVREGRDLDFGSYGNSKIIRREDVDQDEVLACDQVLVGMNRTRQRYNHRIRQLKGFTGDRPVIGDRLVCLKNKSTKGLLNGSLWTPKKFGRDDILAVNMTVASLDDPDTIIPVDVTTPMEFFRGTEGEMDWKQRRRADEFTFGWALTVHKAQGSQYDHVFINDESFIFREHERKWLYTGITRAAERVTILRS